jgi:hypothetical protein
MKIYKIKLEGRIIESETGNAVEVGCRGRRFWIPISAIDKKEEDAYTVIYHVKWWALKDKGINTDTINYYYKN